MSEPARTLNTLRVVDWEKHFENNRTRELKNLSFVLVPNKMDGDGYTELLDHENGVAHFGIWISILEIASRCEIRGTLLRSSRTTSAESRTQVRNGAEQVPDTQNCPLRPHTPQSLGRISRMPAGLYDEAIPRLVEIGWLEWIHTDTGASQNTAVASAESRMTVRESAVPTREQNRTELNRKEQNRTERATPHANGSVRVISPHPATLDPLFQEFWQAIRENRDDAIAKDHDGMWPCWNRLDGSQRVLALENTRLRTIHSQQIFGDLRHYLFSGEYQRPPKTPPKQVKPKTYLQQVAEGITND